MNTTTNTAATTTTTTTNATSQTLGGFLRATDANGMWRGRFASLTVRKVGKEKGRGENRKRYGDDLVQVMLITGFRYDRLVARSLEMLQARMQSPGALEALAALGAVDGKGNLVTEANYHAAYDALVASYQRTLAGENQSTSAHVFEPLVVDGQRLPGCKVYTGEGDPDDPRTPVPGQVNLSGIFVSQRVITPAPNGPVPPPASKAVTVAKDVLTGDLPVSRYVSYRLEPGKEYTLRAGGAALESYPDAESVTVPEWMGSL